jgi:hypothetical protein
MESPFTFLISASKLKFFHFLLQQGIRLETTVGENIRDFLVNRIGLEAREIEEKIQTVFLNGKAVDDLDKAQIKDGASLALSGALPGLVGATMRRGGFYSSLRSPIRYQEEGEDPTRRPGVISLKLFNILLKDFGPRLLAHGFWIESSRLRDFLQSNETELKEGCLIRSGDGPEVSCLKFSDTIPIDPDRFLFVRINIR